ncbi:MAG: UDP-3-O-(3-hydroxymyristoyl)glucosamine N-acyltransferase [Thermodesulfovibrio sp.]|nr:UDP-3-O-(3-hydroxymyristoyl)glucosamine N-acyltransferase [Thermodesulfovibrio sp.]MCX7724020.1 UDP-3-O-(3-hydroxymyristoyl)glucosamine N-acyltransferase [Thermodesulfovibrio sp.]MDW7972356.1 UDP-3-O-(3-hydroxymyristoyl)glucosamine N-acyltransferase [Thermodesulfovibrio sp.]
MKLSEIANLFNAKVEGEEDVEISGVKGLEDAQEGDITYIASSKYAEVAKKSKASAFIVREKLSYLNRPQLICENPQFVFAKLLEIFYIKPHPYQGVSENSIIASTAQIGKNVTVYPFVYIDENVTIGDNTVIYPFTFIGKETSIGSDCLIYPNVTIRERVKIGNRVIIHAGTQIGCDGFGYIFHEGKHYKIPQVGGVIIEDDVEIGACVTIDRATTGNTIIGKGTKIDNLVQIAHNVKIGQNVIIVAQVGIAGSSKVGDGCILAGQVGISDHVEIEAGTIITAQSGVMPGKVQKGIFSGTPIMPHREWLKANAIFQKLPELYKRVKELEEKIKKIEDSKV